MYYRPGQLVSYSGKYYCALQSGSGRTPASNPTSWRFIGTTLPATMNGGVAHAEGG